MDPLTRKYPYYSPYQFAGDKPIWAVDLDGLEEYKLSRNNKGNFSLKYDWNAKPLSEGKIYFNGTPTNISNLAKKYHIRFFNPTPFPTKKYGDINYYRWRNEDFNVRAGLAHMNGSAPKYYLQYGDKYIRRFTYQTSKNLSSAGNEWLVKARSNLQWLMEKGLKSNPKIELNNAKFQQFAFRTHLPAYKHAGFLELDFLDKTYIITTPDAKDLFSKLERQEARAMMKLQIKYDILHPITTSYHFLKLPYQLPAIEGAIERKSENETFKYLYYKYIGTK